MAGTGSSKAVDPIAYRPEEQGNIRTEPVTEKTQDWTFDPRKLKNADVNLGAYGDDSSETNYNNPGLWGGENAKYKGENTKNTTVQYNPYATVEGLNPDYAYGQKAQMVNSDNAGYIQRRNDEIASALYNAGRVSEEDVRQYLMGQKGFMNSTENERENTIKSVWKRLGEISSNRTPAENKSNGEEGLNNIRNDLLKNTGGEIYGKTTADWRGSDRAIKTLQDANSIEAKVAESRIKNFENLQTMDSQAIAASIVSGYTPYGDQGMRDLQKYDPIKYADVQMYVKKLQGQKAVNSISMGNGLDLTSDSDTAEENIQNEKERFAEENSTSLEEKQEILKDVDESLASNQSAQTAEGTMNNIQADINKLKTRLKNLDKEASALFKGDVPQYIVNAYKSNRTKEIQDKISELESTYNAAYDRYKTQLDNEWKQKEYDLKEKQYNREYALSVRKLDLEEQSQTLNAYKTQQEILINKQKLRDGNFFTDKDGNTWEKVTDEDGNTIIRPVPVLKTYEGTGMTGKGYKNNNPGNITDMGFGNPIGNDGKFAIFATPEDGFDALLAKIKYNQTNPSSNYYGSTIWEYTHMYAPEQDENDPKNYANQMANALGVTVDTKIADLDPLAMAKFIAKKESGYNYDTYGQIRGNDVSGDDYDYSNSETLKSIADSFLENNKLGKQEWDTIDKIIQGDNSRRAWDKYLADYIEKKYGQQTELERRADGNEKLFEVLSDDGVTPISFRQRIYNLVPATLKNSEVELKNLYEVAKNLYNAGYTPDEAALVFFGVNLMNDKTGMGYPLINAGRMAEKLPENFYPVLAGYLEQGNTDKAVAYVDNIVLKGHEELVDSTVSSIMKLNALDEALDETTLKGPIKGKIGDFVNKWIGNENYAASLAKLTNAFAAVQNELMGSNITEGEAERFKGMIPTMEDTVESAKNKIREAKNTKMYDLNATRKRLRLPELTELEILDNDKKIELYKEVLGTNSNYNTRGSGNRGNGNGPVITLESGSGATAGYDVDSFPG